MNWRLAESLIVLRRQLDERWPKRDRASDGSIGDQSHAARKSDHNPDKDGVVTAIDIDRDIAPGVNSRMLAEALVASRDQRIKYIISNAQIISGPGGPSPWVWRPYTGVNAHKEHMHISVREDRRDDKSLWRIVISPTEQLPLPLGTRPTIQLGSAGSDVEFLQRVLGNLRVDGDFGPKTKAAVVEYQQSVGLKPDGIVGSMTWKALTKEK